MDWRSVLDHLDRPVAVDKDAGIPDGWLQPGGGSLSDLSPSERSRMRVRNARIHNAGQNELRRILKQARVYDTRFYHTFAVRLDTGEIQMTIEFSLSGPKLDVRLHRWYEGVYRSA